MFDLSWPLYLGSAAAVAAGYVVFGLTGFGAAVVAIPFLAQLMPLQTAVPVVMLFDLAAGLMLGARNWQHLELREISVLLPAMMVGIALGTLVLVGFDTATLLLLLGIFVLANGFWSLRTVSAGGPPVARAWSVPAGLVGGVFGALFGTGGPFYTLYLARRINDKGRLRATISVMILASAISRLVAFLGAGLLLQPSVLMLALALAPVMLISLVVGSRLHARMPQQGVKRAIFGLLMVSGVAVIVRALMML